MSSAPTPVRRSVKTWTTIISAIVTTLGAVLMGGPAVERLRVEASQSKRENVLSRVALAASPNRSTDWKPFWESPDRAVYDYSLDIPPFLINFAPHDEWMKTSPAPRLRLTDPSFTAVIPRQESPLRQKRLAANRVFVDTSAAPTSPPTEGLNRKAPALAID